MRQNLICVYRRGSYKIFDNVSYYGKYSIVNIDKPNKIIKDIRNIKTAKYIINLAYDNIIPNKKESRFIKQSLLTLSDNKEYREKIKRLL